MEILTEPKLENSVKNNIKLTKKLHQRTNINKNRRTYKGKPSQSDLASPACPTHPCQNRKPSPASQPNQHSTANTPQPTSLEWGPAAGGVALKIITR